MKQSRFGRTLLSLTILAALCGSFAFPGADVRAAPGQAPVVSHLVISQVYGAGGNTNASYPNDYVELFNPSDSDLSVNGLSIQYATANGTSWQVTPLTNVSLVAGQYYLVQLAAGANGGVVALPAPDATGSTNISGTAGKIALVNGTTALSGACPTDPSIIDFIGFGATNCFEGLAPAPAPSNATMADLRSGNSCTDTNNNGTDFTTGTAQPRNTSTVPILTCSTPTSTPTATNTATSTFTSTPTATAPAVRSVIINEVAWGGTAASSTDEWFELYNNTGVNINLNGWHLAADDGNPDIALSGTITAADPYFVFARNTAVFNDLTPDKTYSGSLSNNGEILYLLDPNGNQVDTANIDGGDWNAGSGSPTFASMERQGNVADSPAAWATYGGTVPVAHDRANNPIKGTPGQGNWILTITPTPTATATGTAAPTGTPTMTGTPTTGPSVLINEVAWSGTSANSNDEWIELYNPGTSPINITDWKLYGDDNTLNKVGSPNITLSGTIPPDGYFLLERNEQATDVSANQIYASGDLLNTGERLYLKDRAGATIDTANLDGGSWPAGTASTTSTSPPAYASMERVGKTGNQWVTYNGTIPLARDRNGGPIRGTPGNPNWIRTASITTITSDSPDPSVVNQYVNVVVSVVGGITTPTGSVSITGANTNCTITLSNGTGSCQVRFTSTGTKTITATYTSTSGLPPSNDTESHQVATAGTIFTTPTPIPIPPPQLVAINEFVPRPGHDWNGDGVVNVGDEYIELLNHGTVDVNLSGYRLDDEVNIGSNPYSLPAKVLKPGERVVFYGSETGLLLGDGGDGVRLLKPNGQLMDAYNYTVVRSPDQSYCRLPDNGGADDWNQNCYPTPGLQNSLSGTVAVPSGSVGQESLCPIADTLPADFVQAECEPFGNNIWRQEFWDRTGWYNEKYLPGSDTKWPVFAD